MKMVDAGLGVVFAVALAGTAYAFADTWGGTYWVFGSAAGAAVCVLALARRLGVWVAAAGLAIATGAVVVSRVAHLPSEPGPAMVLGLAVLVGSSVRTLPIPWAAAIAGGGLAVVVGTWIGTPAVTMYNILGWLAGVGTGLNLRLLDLRRHATAAQVRRDERLALARELHDIVAHHITGIVLHAQAARIVRHRQPDQLDDSLTGIETASSEALAAMRRVVGLLRDTDDGAPATPGPEQLSELVARFTGPAVRLRQPDGDPGWPPEVTSTVYRVVQESLTNIARHATHAGSVTVDVTQDRHAVTVEVTDDAPPAPSRRGGYGLVGMRERVEALGGTLRAGPRAGQGWAVRATLPLEAR